MGRFYIAAVQAVLLYGSETWTLTDSQIKLLETFHNRCAHQIARKPIWQLPNGEWHIPSTKEVLRAAGIFPIQIYLQRRHQTIRPYTQSLPIYEKCLVATVTQHSTHHIYWWDIQDDLPDPPEDASTVSTTSPNSSIMSDVHDNPIATHHDVTGTPNDATISSCSSNHTGLTDDSTSLFSNALDEFDFSGLDEDDISCTSLISDQDFPTDIA